MTKRAFLIDGIGFGLLTAGLVFTLLTPAENPADSPVVAQTRISAKLNRAPAAINTLTDIKEVFDAEAKERDFLIEEVGLSTNEYLEVKHRQLELHKQLTLSSQVHPLDTVHAERDRQILVKNQV